MDEPLRKQCNSPKKECNENAREKKECAMRDWNHEWTLQKLKHVQVKTVLCLILTRDARDSFECAKRMYVRNPSMFAQAVLLL